MPFVEQDVVGLDVAVNHAMGVRMGQRVGDLARQRHGLGDRDRRTLTESVRQRSPPM